MSRSAPFALGVLLALAASVAMPPRVGAQTTSGLHLYVAVAGSKAYDVQRYPFVDGRPASEPDLIYHNITTPIAVGRGGVLYATRPSACCSGLARIVVYQPHTNVPSRDIVLPNVGYDGTIATALVEGRGRYLYVGFSFEISGTSGARFATQRSLHSPVRGGLPIVGVAVYPPFASGTFLPQQIFDVQYDWGGPFALDFDANGQLYVSTQNGDGNHNRIYTVANPLVKPHVINRLDLSLGVLAQGLATSKPDAELYAFTFGPRAFESNVAVYAAGAAGHASPLRTIALPTSSGWGFAVAGRVIYTGVSQYDNGSSYVLGFDKLGSGQEPPTFSLALPPHLRVVGLVIGQ